MIKDKNKVSLEYNGTITFNGIFIKGLLLGLKKCLDKKDTMWYLDKYLGTSRHLIVHDDNTFSLIADRSIQHKQDDRENMLNMIETTEDESIKPNPTKIKWLREWVYKGELQQKTLSDRLIHREQFYYNKAIKEGMAEKTDNGYKWLYNGGSKVSLAYFLKKIFCPNNIEQIPFKRLNNLWSVSRLDSATDQLVNAKKPQRWRYDIDKLFENNI